MQRPGSSTSVTACKSCSMLYQYDFRDHCGWLLDLGCKSKVYSAMGCGDLLPMELLVVRHEVRVLQHTPAAESITAVLPMCTTTSYTSNLLLVTSLVNHTPHTDVHTQTMLQALWFAIALLRNRPALSSSATQMLYGGKHKMQQYRWGETAGKTPSLLLKLIRLTSD